MVKLFKTKEERDLAFVSKMWERPKRTDKLREVLSKFQTPFELKAYLSDPNQWNFPLYQRGLQVPNFVFGS